MKALTHRLFLLLAASLASSITTCTAESTGHESAAATIHVVKKPLNSLFQRKYYKFEGEYPFFTGSPRSVVDQINKTVHDEVTGNIPDPDAGWSDTPVSKDAPNVESCSYHIQLLDNKYLSMDLVMSHCYSGKPHPISSVTSLNYFITPKFKAITLGDLVGPKANYKRLEASLKKSLSAPSGQPEDTELGIAADDNRFVFDRKGIQWNWSDYALGSYTGGARQGYLSFKQLKGIADPKSLAAQMAQ